MPFTLFGQSYSALWKQVKEADSKDLPKTQVEVLQKIVDKASKEKAYGQLLKAELMNAQVMAQISPDSLKPAVGRIAQRSSLTKDEVLKTVYQTVLYRVSQENRQTLDIEAGENPYLKPVLTAELCSKLAAVKDEAYEPFVLKGTDSKLFDHDLLSIVGYELEDYQPLHDYYVKSGNRQAACLTSLKVIEQNRDNDREELHKSTYLQTIDSVIHVYDDLPEAGELAIEHYNFMDKATDASVEDKIRYIHYALGKWGGWQRMNILRNAEKQLTNPQFRVEYDLNVVTPQKAQTVRLKDLRNLSSFKMAVYPVKANGDEDLSPQNAEGYKRMKPLLGPVVKEVERRYIGKPDYELFTDSLQLEGLPVGVYMLEFSSPSTSDVIRKVYYVTDVYTIAESQPGSRTRYVVVSATTGQPIAKAKLRIKEYTGYQKFTTHSATTDAKGEYIHQHKDTYRREVWAYTEQDKACPEMDLANRYHYYGNQDETIRTSVYTDRAIYRPGQTVHAAVIIYQTRNGFEHQVCEGRQVRFTLRDANFKVVAEHTAQTDKYGTCAADFTLPSSGLTGQYSIQANTERNYFRVEEYKRPTFEVTFPEVNEPYEDGDTVVVRATARSYAGVPVQGATVKYKVVRRLAFWWWSYCRYWSGGFIGTGSDDEEVFAGEAVTDEKGMFPVEMPMQLPKTSYPMFYHFVATADVTDTAGETHSGQISLPLGNRKTALSVDLAEQLLLEDKPAMTFHLRNAAGNDIAAEVLYRIDNGSWQSTNTQHLTPITQHPSGKHSLEAICQGDTIHRDFVVFSLDDKRPATETDDWFYVSSSQFPNDGKPVTLQVGSSAKDVHIVYSIFSGEQLLESGAVDKNNELINRKFVYKEAWGNGIVCNFAWVKDGKCYTHSVQIQRPLPDKHLQLQWTTFRDRLTPGQQEEWTLTVTKDSRPVDAQLMATLFDKSLDQLQYHRWGLSPYVWLPMPSVSWSYAHRYPVSDFGSLRWSQLSVRELNLSEFDQSLFRRYYGRNIMVGTVMRSVRLSKALAAAPMVEMAVMEDSAADEEVVVGYAAKQTADTGAGAATEADEAETQTAEQAQVRENLNETAFFYPQLTTDDEGQIALKFTLPESLTTWRFMGLAHTQDMCYGSLSGEAVAQKDVMIQPNVPRFIREGDQAVIAARIFNIGEKDVKGAARLKLIDPVTDAVVYEACLPFETKTGETTSVSFAVDPVKARLSQYSLLVCQVVASGKDFSDGEQHYLPILPSTERVTVTLPFTQTEPGTKTLDLGRLIPATGTNGKLTFEYTNQPAWLMIQALPALCKPSDENAISQAASYYVNSLGKFIIDQNPKVKTVFDLWKKEQGSETSLMSALEKNQELKDLVLNETPWVLDADRETEQKQRLSDFFDENIMQLRLSDALRKLEKLQRSGGAWSWWPDMPGSFYMTVAVSEMLVRLNALTQTQTATSKMLTGAFRFMGKEIVEDVKEMKKWEKKGHKPAFPSFKTLQWLYLCTLDGRTLPADVQEANDYLLALLKKDIKNQTIYEKVMTAVILSKSDPTRSAEYVRSLKEYTVYREDMGRYYDTPKAGYSWYDYRIPTQTMAIEALLRLTPDDRQTIQEMQRWLLQEKRTQAWDTPINSVNAVYAFLQGSEKLRLDGENSTFKVDDQPLQTPDATVALGYVKTVLPDAKAQTLSVQKTSEGTSWGAVYAQFTQPVSDIKASGSGISVKREVIGDASKVGNRITVRLTIVAERDLDFVQVVDKRAACMEPVRQLSGYRNGAYCTPHENTTNYYFDRLAKGKHVVETEYYIDRPGTYETGTCTVQCAYAPEFRATAKSVMLKVEN